MENCAVNEHGNNVGSEFHIQRQWIPTTVGNKVSNGEWIQNHISFTVMSYNILADELMRRHSNLYSQPDNLLEWNERWQRILKEIQEYDPDILCCQEVQNDHFQSQISPALSALNFNGFYKQRTGGKNDGCAIFYKRDKFMLEDVADVEYHQPYVKSLNRDNIALFAKFRPLQLSDTHQSHTQQNLKDNNQSVAGNSIYDSLIVATTHLLYNPKREDVRLAQMAVLFAELDRFAFKSVNDLELNPPKTRQEYFYPIILTGDFNLSPDTFISKFLSDGNINYSGSTTRPNEPLFSPSLFITDSCQHLSVILERISSVIKAHKNEEPDPSRFTKLVGGRTELKFTNEIPR